MILTELGLLQQHKQMISSCLFDQEASEKNIDDFLNVALNFSTWPRNWSFLWLNWHFHLYMLITFYLLTKALCFALFSHLMKKAIRQAFTGNPHLCNCSHETFPNTHFTSGFVTWAGKCYISVFLRPWSHSDGWTIAPSHFTKVTQHNPASW